MNKLMALFRIGFTTFLVIAVSAACVASMLTAVPDASGGFILNGKDLKDMTSMAIDVGYETEVLTNPVLSNGLISQRAKLAIVNQQPGLLSFTVSRENSPFSGSGVLVNLSFSKIADLPGKLTYINASYTDREGTQHPMETSILYSPVKDEMGAGKGSGGAGGKNVAQQPPAQGGNSETAQGEVTAGDGVITAADGKQASRSRSYRKVQSVLARFCDYSGNRDLPALKALFDRKDTVGIKQEPAVALSDGKTPVKVSIKVEAAGGVPSFALKGAGLTSLKTADPAVWVLELMPVSGKYEVILTVFTDAAIIEYPLAIAPPLADLAAMESGALPAYVRDYIEAANKIVSEAAPASDH